MQLIDGCSLEQCVAPLSVVSSGVVPQEFNIARLFQDGSIIRHPFTFTLHLRKTMKFCMFLFLHKGLSLQGMLNVEIQIKQRGNLSSLAARRSERGNVDLVILLVLFIQ